MHTALVIVLLCFARLLFAGPPLLFVGDDDFPPYSYEVNGEIVGIDIELIREMARRLNLNIKIQLVSWKRLILMTQNGTCDGSFSLFYTKEREKFSHFAFSQPVHTSSFPIFYSKDQPFQFNTVADLFGKTIGINRGFTISDEFEKAVKLGKISVNIENEVDENIVLTALGQIDGFTNNLDVTLYKLKHKPRLTKYRTHILYTDNSLSARRHAYLVLSKNAKNIRNKKERILDINRTFTEMQDSGFYLQVRATYLE